MEPWFFNEVMLKHDWIWGGLTQAVKSMASKTHGMHVSEYHITKDKRDDLVPSTVTAKNIDFFRGEPNTI